MLAECRARCVHTVRLPSKPIPWGFKILALCDAGYTLNWLYTSRIDGIAELKPHQGLTPTGAAILQLCNIFNTNLHHVVYMDNAFTTVPLLRTLRQQGIGGCSTIHINLAEFPAKLKSNTKHV
jgi:hypothetical protein